MGMTRSGGTAHGFWTGAERVNPLYGSRYSMDLLRKDQPDKFLVGFYGMLAQGLTRDTFIGGEGCTLDPVDAGGRFFYCPPNSWKVGCLLPPITCIAQTPSVKKIKNAQVKLR